MSEELRFPSPPAIKETISGVPLGLSRDYGELPRTGPLREVRCSTCWQLYEDVERLLSDGCRVLAMRCFTCREQGRSKWIAKYRVELPKAFASFRKGVR